MGNDKKRTYKLSLISHVVGACWGTACFGYASGVIANTLGQPSFISYMGLDTAHNATQLLGVTSAMFYVGGCLGPILGAWLADRYGRKIAIMTGTIIILISAAILSGSANIAMFIAFRFFSGVGAFINLGAVPLWVTEIVPAHGRGIIADINAIFILIGFFTASWVGVGFFFVESPSAWRGPFAIGCVPCIIGLIWLYFIPETPRYFLLKDQPEKAWEIVRNLHSVGDDESFATKEFNEMVKQIEVERRLHVSYLDMIRIGPYRKRVILTCILICTLQASGILVIASKFLSTILYSFTAL